MDKIPPSLDALIQHILRCAFQAMIWNECLYAIQPTRDPSDWGWRKGGGEVGADLDIKGLGRKKLCYASQLQLQELRKETEQL